MENATTKGFCHFGIAILKKLEKNTVMDDYDAGEKAGSMRTLDEVMSGFVGAQNWLNAKTEYHAPGRIA